MADMNAQPTAQVIREMAETLRETALRLEREADQLEKTGEFEHHCPTVINTIVNVFNNIRLDLLIARPIREYIKAVVTAEEKCKDK